MGEIAIVVDDNDAEEVLEWLEEVGIMYETEVV